MADCIHGFIVLALVSLVAAACNAVFMSKTADPRIVADGLRVFVPIPDRLDHCIDDLGFFPITGKTGLDLLMACVTFRRGQEVDFPSITSKIVFSV